MISKNTIFQFLTLGVLITLFLFINLKFPIIRSFADYKAFLIGAHILVQNPSQFYDIEFQKSIHEFIKADNTDFLFLPFRSMPLAALPYLFYINLSFDIGYALFIVLNLILYFVFIKTFFKKHPDKIAGAFLLSNLFLFFSGTLFLGQISFYLLFVLFFIFKYYKAEDFKKVGLLSSLLLLKMQFLPLAIGLIALSKSKVAQSIYFAIGACLIIIVNFVLLGISIPDYINFIHQTETYEYGSRLNEMASIQLFFSNNLPMSLFNANVVSGVIYGIGFLLFWKLSRNQQFNSSLFSLAILFFTVFGLHINGNEFILFTLPLVLGFVYPKEKDIKFLYIFLMFILCLIFYFARTWVGLSIVLFVFGNLIAFKTKKGDSTVS